MRAYSKGMTQKLGLAACFLSRKDLYVLDEPTSGLDPKARARSKRSLRAARNRGPNHLLHVARARRRRGDLRPAWPCCTAGSCASAGTPAGLREQSRGDSLEQAFLDCIEDAAPDRWRGEVLGPQPGDLAEY